MRGHGRLLDSARGAVRRGLDSGWCGADAVSAAGAASARTSTAAVNVACASSPEISRLLSTSAMPIASSGLTLQFTTAALAAAPAARRSAAQGATGSIQRAQLRRLTTSSAGLTPAAAGKLPPMPSHISSCNIAAGSAAAMPAARCFATRPIQQGPAHSSSAAALPVVGLIRPARLTSNHTSSPAAVGAAAAGRAAFSSAPAATAAQQAQALARSNPGLLKRLAGFGQGSGSAGASHPMCFTGFGKRNTLLP